MVTNLWNSRACLIEDVCVKPIHARGVMGNTYTRIAMFQVPHLGEKKDHNRYVWKRSCMLGKELGGQSILLPLKRRGVLFRDGRAHLENEHASSCSS